MNKQMLEILKAVTVSSKDNGTNWTDTTRLDVIKERLGSSDYKILNRDGTTRNDLYMLFGKEDLSKSKKYIVISTHVDTLMNRFFVEQKDSNLIGTFDNAITNAAVLYNMLNSKFDNNILIAFTGNEECGMRGAKNLYKYLSDYDVISYMVLDVSWEDYYKNSFTLENIELPDEAIKKILVAAKHTQEKYIVVSPYDFDDETEVYSDNFCFSYCIPIMNDDEMHSNVGVETTVELFEKYTDTMPLIAKALL
ncbi:MAG: M28 family peptidase [Clostridiaceae bacterium]|jgi:hypothetical protein|nr:M28 family peptidase [Clostridiaceae bacterium]